MCQPKSEGGKRCLGHSAYTKFTRRYVKLETGADDATINEAYKELVKEGRNVEAPTKKEFEKEVLNSKIELAVSDINAHDKKILNNQLDTAMKEAEKQGVAGRAWHVWTNLKTRVISKMKAAGTWMKTKGAKIFVAGGLIGSVAFGVAGCAPQNAEPTPTPSVSQSQTPSPEPTAFTPSEYGDLVTLVDENGNPVIITNEYGEYEHVTISPEDDAYSDHSVVDANSLQQAGLTEEDGVRGQQFVAKYVVENVIDGPGVDSEAGYQTWVKETSRDVISPKYYDDIMTPKNNYVTGRQEIFGGPFMADGKSRVSTAKVTIDSVTGYADAEKGDKFVAVTGSFTSQHRMSDESLIKIGLEQNPGTSREDIIATYPKLGDGKDNNFYQKEGTFTYYVDSNNQIGGYTTNFGEGKLDYR